MIYLQPFLSYLQIGAFSFGGGYAAMSLIQAQVVDKYHGQYNRTIYRSCHDCGNDSAGPIAINSATFVGTQVGGISVRYVPLLAVFYPPALSSPFWQKSI